MKKYIIGFILVLGLLNLALEDVKANEQHFDSYHYELVNLGSSGADVNIKTFTGMNSSIYFNVTNYQNHSVYVNITSYNSSLIKFSKTNATLQPNGSLIFYGIINTSYVYSAQTDVVFNLSNITTSYNESRLRNINIDVYKALFELYPNVEDPYIKDRIIIADGYEYFNYVPYFKFRFNITKEGTYVEVNASEEIESNSYGKGAPLGENVTFKIRPSPKAYGENKTVYFSFNEYSETYDIYCTFVFGIKYTLKPIFNLSSYNFSISKLEYNENRNYTIIITNRYNESINISIYNFSKIDDEYIKLAKTNSSEIINLEPGNTTAINVTIKALKTGSFNLPIILETDLGETLNFTEEVYFNFSIDPPIEIGNITTYWGDKNNTVHSNFKNGTHAVLAYYNDKLGVANFSVNVSNIYPQDLAIAISGNNVTWPNASKIVAKDNSMLFWGFIHTNISTNEPTEIETTIYINCTNFTDEFYIESFNITIGISTIYYIPNQEWNSDDTFQDYDKQKKFTFVNLFYETITINVSNFNSSNYILSVNDKILNESQSTFTISEQFEEVKLNIKINTSFAHNFTSVITFNDTKRGNLQNITLNFTIWPRVFSLNQTYYQFSSFFNNETSFSIKVYNNLTNNITVIPSESIDDIVSPAAQSDISDEHTFTFTFKATQIYNYEILKIDFNAAAFGEICTYQLTLNVSVWGAFSATASNRNLYMELNETKTVYFTVTNRYNTDLSIDVEMINTEADVEFETTLSQDNIDLKPYQAIKINVTIHVTNYRIQKEQFTLNFRNDQFDWEIGLTVNYTIEQVIAITEFYTNTEGLIDVNSTPGPTYNFLGYYYDDVIFKYQVVNLHSQNLTVKISAGSNKRIKFNDSTLVIQPGKKVSFWGWIDTTKSNEGSKSEEQIISFKIEEFKYDTDDDGTIDYEAITNNWLPTIKYTIKLPFIISDDSWDIGTVMIWSDIKNKTYTITNNYNRSIKLNITLSDDEHFHITASESLNLSLDPDESVNISFWFEPNFIVPEKKNFEINISTKLIGGTFVETISGDYYVRGPITFSPTKITWSGYVDEKATFTLTLDNKFSDNVTVEIICSAPRISWNITRNITLAPKGEIGAQQVIKFTINTSTINKTYFGLNPAFDGDIIIRTWYNNSYAEIEVPLNYTVLAKKGWTTNFTDEVEKNEISFYLWIAIALSFLAVFGIMKYQDRKSMLRRLDRDVMHIDPDLKNRILKRKSKMNIEKKASKLLDLWLREEQLKDIKKREKRLKDTEEEEEDEKSKEEKEIELVDLKIEKAEHRIKDINILKQGAKKEEIDKDLEENINSIKEIIDKNIKKARELKKDKNYEKALKYAKVASKSAKDAKNIAKNIYKSS